ncbi:hypothetical protein GCM10023091_07010 [Ravibacter arvi]|uniref:Type IX secretion system protein PorV domain-containing protein n=1 Tax=Ravibacter arvi TaxID=2051041 RepID=A0ABP8LP55_9BACT
MKRILAVLSITFLHLGALAQPVNNSDKTIGRIPAGSTLAFLNIAPDARSAALGDAGVAATPDANATYWNASKLAFIEQDHGLSLSYTPWLGDLTDDMFIGYLTGFKKLEKGQTIAGSLHYMNNGEIDLRDGMGGSLGNYNSKELALSGTYSRQLSSKLALGLTLKWIYSNLAGNNVGTGASVKPANTAAGDISLYYNDGFKDQTSGKEFTYGLGLTFSNFGGKISYGSGSYFIPTMLRLGGRITYSGDGIHKFNLLLDANKHMVPTPPYLENYVDGNGNTQTRVVAGRSMADLGLMKGVFGSFSDAPDGFSEELSEIAVATGLEYIYHDVFAARVGYFGQSEKKLGHSNVSFGLGAKFKKTFNVDFAYMIPLRQASPLAQTWRLTLGFALNKATDVAE